MKKIFKRSAVCLLLCAALVLTSCSDSDSERAGKLESAKALLAAGRYADAAEAFSALSGYENADTYLRYAEAARKKNSGDYAGAQAGFEALGDFLDSAVQAREAAGQAEQEAYNAATEALRVGDYAAAVEGFSGLDGYGDASLQLMYARAMQMAEAGDYDLAISSLETLGDFRDSRMQSIYYSGRRAEEAQDWETADGIYRSVAAFRDAGDRLNALADRRLDGDFAAAASRLAEEGWTDEIASVFEDLSGKAYTSSETLMDERITAVAEQALTDGMYDAALGLFGLTANGAARVTAVKVAQAGAQREAGDPEAALATLEGVDGSEAAQLRRELSAELADAAVEAHDMARAHELLLAAGDVNDSAARAQAIESDYAAAITLLSEGKYDESHEAFLALYNYSDAERMASEALYRKAVSLVSAGEYEAAAEQFAALGSYSDSALQMKAVWYHKAEACIEKGEYEEASEAFAAAGDYADAASRIDEPYYLQGVALLEAGDEIGAFAAFTKAASYGDAEEQIRSIYYGQGQRFEAEGAWDKAVENYMKAGNYEDAEARMAECMEKMAQDLFEEGKYDEANAVSATVSDLTGEIPTPVVPEAAITAAPDRESPEETPAPAGEVAALEDEEEQEEAGE